MVLQWTVMLYCYEHFLAIILVRVYSMLVRLMSCLLLCVCYVGFSCYLDLWFVPLMLFLVSFVVFGKFWSWRISMILILLKKTADNLWMMTEKTVSYSLYDRRYLTTDHTSILFTHRPYSWALWNLYLRFGWLQVTITKCQPTALPRTSAICGRY